MREVQSRSPEQGAALLIALFFFVLAAMLVSTGTLAGEHNRRKTETNFRKHAQATQFARSGLTEALSWFRRQTSQPVTHFEPRVDRDATIPVLDTIDPEIGIVREYPIEGDVWGRYEVWREWSDDPVAERQTWRERMQARDVSRIRGRDADGQGWRLRSIGYVFTRRDAAKAYDEHPNHVVATSLLESEIVRLKLNPPGQAAISVFAGTSLHINTNGRVRGGALGAGAFFPAGTGTPTTGPANAARVTGTPALAPSTSFDGSVEAVFGVSIEELESLADDVVTDPDGFPSPIPAASILVASTPSLHFDEHRPLRGNGIVFVRGNVEIEHGSASHFIGLLYVDGNLTLRAPCTFDGAVVCTGNVSIQGSGDYAEVNYDDGALAALRMQIGQYRQRGAIRPMDGR